MKSESESSREGNYPYSDPMIVGDPGATYGLLKESRTQPEAKVQTHRLDQRGREPEPLGMNRQLPHGLTNRVYNINQPIAHI